MAGQHGGGHGPHASGDGGNGTHHGFGRSEIHVTHQMAGGVHIDTHVDDHLAGGEAVGTDNPGPSSGGDQQLCPTAFAKSAVRVWQRVTVAFRFSSSIAAGLPMTRLRPTTTARLPVGSKP